MLGLGASLLSSVGSGIMSMFGQSSANAANMALMQKQEDYNTEMSNSAYQRASADMTKAGLNPMMMFGSGAAASTPGIQVPQMQNTMSGMASSLGGAVSSAMQQRVSDATIDNLVQQNANLKTSQALTEAQIPGVKGKSDVSARESGAVMKIPDPVYTPLVQGGYGADTMKSTGQIGSLVGAGAASAKSVVNGVSDLVPTGMSGPSVSSAGELVDQLKKKAPALGQAVSNWWNDSGQSTYYKNGSDTVSSLRRH